MRQGRLFAVVFVASLAASAAGAVDMRGTTIPNFGTDPTQLPVMEEAPSLPAQPVAPTRVEEVAPQRPLLPLPETAMNPQQVAILPDEKNYFEMRGDAARYAPLESVRLALDMQNVTLKQAVEQIVQDAAPKVGPWQVRWQLTEENRYLLDELMNITAETTFDEFLSYMTEKVVNMSGVKLTTKVFNVGRVILISDS